MISSQAPGTPRLSLNREQRNRRKQKWFKTTLLRYQTAENTGDVAAPASIPPGPDLTQQVQPPPKSGVA